MINKVAEIIEWTSVNIDTTNSHIRELLKYAIEISLVKTYIFNIFHSSIKFNCSGKDIH